MCCKFNQPSALESSETLCEAPFYKAFNFDFYFEHFQPKHITTKNSSFLEWFVGFSEGDGSFITVEKRCFFMINQKDIKLLYKIRKFLGFGQVICYTQNNRKYGRFLVQDQKNCERLAFIFNGNLVLNKTNKRFQIWLKTLKIQPLESKAFFSLENAWLAGFIDAEGCFYARIRKNARNKTGYQVVRKFSIGQKGELEVLIAIKALLKNNSMVYKHPLKNENYYRIEVHSIVSTNILLNYLKKFPCLGQKQRSIYVYQRLNELIIRKEHLILNKLQNIKKLCQQLKNTLL